MAKSPKIEELYRPLLATLPATLMEQGEPFALSPDTLPEPPKRFSTDRVICLKGWHFYGSSYRVDTVQFFASRDMFRILGLWMLSVLLRPSGPRSRLDLTHPLCDVTSLIAVREEPGDGEATCPPAFVYTPELVGKHPFIHDGANVWDLPCFTLTNEREMVETEKDYSERHRLVGFGHAAAMARLALVLLDFGRPDNMVPEIDLEEEAGYRGVSPTSAEARFALPGSEPWHAIADAAPELGAE